MDINSKSNVQQFIKRFRILAIVFACFIAILTSLMLLRITSTLDSTSATQINMAGNQRVLSQRILTDAHMIHTAIITKDWDTLEPAFDELRSSTTELFVTQQSLLKESTKLSLDSDYAKDQADAFAALNRPLEIMLSSSRELQTLTASMIRRAPYIDQQTFQRVKSAKTEITQAHALFAPKMDELVGLYEQEYQRTIKSSIRSAKIGMVILVAVLTAILLFVIEPTFLIIRKQVAELGVSIQHAQRADAVRWRLLTNIGHEFRTPMNAIMGFADLLNEDELSDTERSRLVTSIFDSSTQLTTLIETMLDMSAIEAGQLHVNKGRCDLYQSLTKITAETKSLAVLKGIDVNLAIDKDCPQFIETDHKRFEQIMMKITENSVKFTEKGCININAKVIEHNNNQLLEISIADTGIGITEDHIHSIFNPFNQSEDALTREYGGAGLGLSISRDIAKALGGNVVVASTPGRGSIFTITINPGDLQAMKINPNVTNPAHAATTPKPLKGCKLLVVDDAKDNRMLLKHILKKTGAEIEFAMDGKQALDSVDSAMQSNEPFDLILMDMQMPVMDGYLATVKLRESGNNIPVIAVTAHALEGDREHCLDSGCNEYLTKPINKELLIETCARLIKECSSPETVTKAA
ncbi:MAG: response regulator [Phycisphaerales bacterium]|nr:response regulator [Phycisphaerales bacterium]